MVLDQAEITLGHSPDLERSPVRMDPAPLVEHGEAVGVVDRAAPDHLGHQCRDLGGTLPRDDDGQAPPADDAGVDEHRLRGTAGHGRIDVLGQPVDDVLGRSGREHLGAVGGDHELGRFPRDDRDLVTDHHAVGHLVGATVRGELRRQRGPHVVGQPQTGPVVEPHLDAVSPRRATA